MKKLIISFALVISAGIGLNAGNLSDDEFNELWNDCLDNRNEYSCQRCIDEGLRSVKECDEKTCTNIGFVYDVIKNYYQASVYYKKSCETFNSSQACYNLAHMYDNGEGIRQDYLMAKKYYEKACRANNAGACHSLSILYYEGRGVRQDKSIAKKYAGKACDLGNQRGCNNYKQGIQ